ncbi:MAG: hypothetical protein L6Q55_13780 [Azonexus sp.]|nr:hypothetical protein [Azonexus sp.]MCK6413472.1 hypothetical protein [Azonexus sp.]
MRSLLIASVAALALSACASQSAAPASSSAAKAPQCWNGDLGAFQAVGTQATISGVTVSCKTTSDGKNAQWMGAGH